MRAPKKVIAAMAIATLIGGAAVPAFAAGNDTSNFTPMATTGEKPLQKVTDPSKSKAEGDINVNGKFTRTVTSYPQPTTKGDYLQVTMPIELKYVYNLDDHKISSSEGEITNQSVHVADDNVTQTGKAVKMSFVGLQDRGRNKDVVQYVKSTTADTVGKAQLPFGLKVTTSKGSVHDVALADIEKARTDAPIGTVIIDSGNTLTLEVEKLGDVVYDQNVLNDKTVVSDSVKLQFEYMPD